MERDRGIDIARGFSMILVIAGHSLEMFFNKEQSPLINFNPYAYEVWRVIYSFHMPAFFFLSGLASSPDRKNPAKILSDSVTLLLMAFFTHLIGCIVAMAIGADKYSSLYEMVKPLTNGWQGLSLRITWFLVSLAFVQVLGALFVRNGLTVRAFVVVGCVGLFAAGHRYGISGSTPIISRSGCSSISRGSARRG